MQRLRRRSGFLLQQCKVAGLQKNLTFFLSLQIFFSHSSLTTNGMRPRARMHVTSYTSLSTVRWLVYFENKEEERETRHKTKTDRDLVACLTLLCDISIYDTLAEFFFCQIENTSRNADKVFGYLVFDRPKVI